VRSCVAVPWLSGWLRAAVGFDDGGGAALRDRAAAR
jgi:hypothetical protein